MDVNVPHLAVRNGFCKTCQGWHRLDRRGCLSRRGGGHRSLILLPVEPDGTVLSGRAVEYSPAEEPVVDDGSAVDDKDGTKDGERDVGEEGLDEGEVVLQVLGRFLVLESLQRSKSDRVICAEILGRVCRVECVGG